MAITPDVALAMRAEREAVAAVEAASPLPGTYLLTATNGEVVHGYLSFLKGFRGARLRAWDVCGARYWDEQIAAWKVGPRVSGPGMIPKPIAVRPDAVIAYMLAIVRVLPGQVLGLSHRVSVSPEDGDRTDIVSYRYACTAWTPEEAVDRQFRIHDEVERVAPGLAGGVGLDEETQ